MEKLFETDRLIVRSFRNEDAPVLYENHMDGEVQRWFPNECYADLAEARGAVCFYADCVTKGQLPFVLGAESKETGELRVIWGRVVKGNTASVSVLEKSCYRFVKEEFGAEDDPYGNGMLVYRKEC